MPCPSLSSWLDHRNDIWWGIQTLLIANSLVTLVSDPDLYRLLTFHVPNLISLFHCSGHREGSVWFWGFLRYFVTSWSFCSEELLAPRLTTKVEDHHLSAVRHLLFVTFAPNLHIWWPFLHPKAEEAPCRGDRDPVTTVRGTHSPLWRGIAYYFGRGPFYYCDRDPLISVNGDPVITVKGTHLLAWKETQLSLWQGPTYWRERKPSYHLDRDPLIGVKGDPVFTMTGTHLLDWKKTQLSLWQGPTYWRERRHSYHCNRNPLIGVKEDPVITVTGTHLSRYSG